MGSTIHWIRESDEAGLRPLLDLGDGATARAIVTYGDFEFEVKVTRDNCRRRVTLPAGVAMDDAGRKHAFDVWVLRSLEQETARG